MTNIYFLTRNMIRRFNKPGRHKIEKWMTNELLMQIVSKNQMYVEWKLPQ